MNARWSFPQGPLGEGPQACVALLDGVLSALWLVDASDLRIVAANAAAGRLLYAAEDELVGRLVFDFAVTPEDHAYWRSASGTLEGVLESETLVRRSDGALVPVTRRIGPLPTGSGPILYVVSFVSREDEVRRGLELDQHLAGLQATLESLGDGILVTDLRGRISNFNRRFAELWEIPEELRQVRDDDALLDWMQTRVIDPPRYVRRLAALQDAAMLRASDLITLHSGQIFERVTAPQCSRGRLIGRVFTFREIRHVAPGAHPVP